MEKIGWGGIYIGLDYFLNSSFTKNSKGNFDDIFHFHCRNIIRSVK